MLGTDTVTLFKKQPDDSFARFVIPGVQWSEKSEVINTNGRSTVTKYVEVTFFEGTYEGLDLNSFTEEDVIFFGEIAESATDGRISALVSAFSRCGVVKSVNDNSNRRYLKNVKVVLI